MNYFFLICILLFVYKIKKRRGLLVKQNIQNHFNQDLKMLLRKNRLKVNKKYLD